MATRNVAPRASGEGKVGTSSLPWGEGNFNALKIGGVVVPTVASPALTGVPTSPTAAPGTNTTQHATTAFVTAAIAALTANVTGPSVSVDNNLVTFDGITGDIQDSGSSISDLLSRANHTGTQLISTISDAGTSASLDVPAAGDAAAGEVVKGNDTRLTDDRDPNAHAASHIQGGTDSIDADQLQIDVTFANITPNITPGEVTSTTHLGAILAGIDDFMATPIAYTDEEARDAVGAALVTGDTNSINATLDDAGDGISLDVQRKSAGLGPHTEGSVGEDEFGLYVDLGTTSITAASGADSRFPTDDEKDALVGTSGLPSSLNLFVTDADTRLIDSAAITGKSTVTGASGDFVLIVDASDSFNLKKVNVSEFIGSGLVSSDITGKTLVTAASSDTVLIADNSDSDALKKVDVADFLAGAAFSSSDITGQVEVTGAGGDHVVISDVSDAGNLKKVLISDFFDMDNMVEGTTTKILTATERSEIAANTAANHAAVTVSDSAEIDFTLAGQDITASLIAGSIDETKLDASVNASLDLADSALQSADIGVTVQAYDADLTTWATLTPSVNAQSLVTAANYAAMRTLLDLEPGTDFYSISAADAAFATSAQGTLADSATQPGDNVSTLTNDSGYLTEVGLADFDTNVGDAFSLMVGTSLDTPSVTVASDGITITLSIERSGGGDIRYFFSDGVYTLDCTPAATVTLTAGSDTAPTHNYVYLNQVTKTLTASTSGWPSSTEHAHVATVLCQSAPSLQTDGPYKVHVWTDHAESESGANVQGHLSHLNEWIRAQNATWEDGIALTPTVGASTFDVATTSGNILQLHIHDFPALDTSTGDKIYIANHPDTAYRAATDLTQTFVDKDTTGATLGAAGTDFYNLVIWGCVSEDAADCKLFCNVPSGAYPNNNGDVASVDSDETAVYTIPTEFRGTGFLIARLTVQENAGTYSIVAQQDLRGLSPAIASGGSGSSSQNEFSDNLFRIQDEGDVSKEVAFQVSGLTTATTRTITVPDADGTLAFTSDITGDVAGPASATDNAIALYDGTTGKLISDSAITFASNVIQSSGATLDIKANAGTSGFAKFADTYCSISGPDGTDSIVSFDGSVDIITNNSTRISVTDLGMQLGGANARVTTIIDDDTMATASATTLATSESVKAYVDASGGLASTDIDTLAELNAIVTDATLIDTADSRLSDSRQCDNTFVNAATAKTNLSLNLVENTAISTWAGTTSITTLGTITTGTWNGGVIASAYLTAATTSAAGIAELATAAETSTGTDTGRTITPDALEASTYNWNGPAGIALGDETTSHTASTSVPVATFHAQRAITLIDIPFGVTTAPTGSAMTFDVHKNGTTIFSTKPTIDATEKHTSTAATAAVLSTTAVSAGDLIEIFVDSIGVTIAGAGGKCYFNAKHPTS